MQLAGRAPVPKSALWKLCPVGYEKPTEEPGAIVTVVLFATAVTIQA